MNLEPSTKERIEQVVGADRIVLFMKGTRVAPQCGFSAATIGILDSLAADYETINVLEDQEIREGIKAFSNWPTIPQLYVNGEFMGGSDIAKQMFNTGELHQVLGLEEPDRTPPQITISDAAAETILGALKSNPGMAVQLSIDARWQHGFNLGAVEGHEIKAESNGVLMHMDVATAQKARGLSLDMEDTFQGKAFKVNNPNAPEAVRQMAVTDLKAHMDADKEVHLIDVRPSDERQQAFISGAIALEDGGAAQLEALSRDAMLVFYCHSGQRSQSAAEHFRIQGFNNVHNLEGGIDAWSRDVDASVPRY
jgi:monothiol glutaredoxin